MRTIINYQKSDGKWYQVTCYDYYIEDEKFTSTNTERAEILPGQCPACHGCGNVEVSHINECSQCHGTGKTEGVASQQPARAYIRNKFPG